MAINKSTKFSNTDQELAQAAKVMGHPARIEILKILAERNTCICGEVVEILPLSQSTVSQHLRELKNAGFILGTIDGVRSCYCINWPFVQKIARQWNAFFADLTKWDSFTKEV